MQDKYDVLCVGCGLSGVVFAERLANLLNKKVLIIDKRSHIGGNCYDYENDFGIKIHSYGPHYFRTNSKTVLNYLSNFTDWQSHKFKVKVHTHGQIWDFPINLNTLEQVKKIQSHFSPQQVIEQIKNFDGKKYKSLNAEDFLEKKIGKTLYEIFYKNYTKKHWGQDVSTLASSIVNRIPIRTNYDDNFLNEDFQGLPKNGYTKVFENIVNSSNNILLMLDSDFSEIKEKIKYKYLVYTGTIDSYFNYKFGKLPYRSLIFKQENFKRKNSQPYFYQNYPQINYPNEHKFTRILEYKHFIPKDKILASKKLSENTTIVKEFPTEHQNDNEPFYPIPSPKNEIIYKKYLDLAKTEKNTLFLGRLATYKYINMDEAVFQALRKFKKLKKILEKI